ncbi:hypothetical protein [Streptomyces galilaeus]|uniref:hypothetical protein n=2 Tax=Streptomyces TaxID=1883 RepID=UPI0038F7426B
MLGLAAALATISVALWLQGLDTAVGVAGLVSVVVGIAAAVWTPWAWSRRWTPVDLEAARENLVGLVRRQ